MARITQLPNLLRGNRKTQPIQREIGQTEIRAARELAELAAVQRRVGPDLPEPPHVNVPQLAGGKAKSGLGGGTLRPMTNDKAR